MEIKKGLIALWSLNHTYSDIDFSVQFFKGMHNKGFNVLPGNGPTID